MQKKGGTMSCSTVFVNNFTKAEDFNLDGEFRITAKMKRNQKAIMKEYQNSSLRSTNDMSQTICLFKKYLTKAQNNIGRTNMEESQFIKKCHSDKDLSVPVSECDPRVHGKASLLEQKLLPRMRCNGAPSSMSEDRSSSGQLTIFYGGAINVYDNVPLDKAQAIMLLAAETSLSKTAATEIPQVDTQTSHQSNVTPTSKIKTGPSMARRFSLQCFLKKRRDRMVEKSPYASPIPKHKAELTMNEEYPYQNHGVSLAPFPSHVGFNFPVSVDNAC